MIIIEGPDGSGKSMLISRLKHTRRSYKSINGGVGGDTAKGWANKRPAMVAYVDEVLRQQHQELVDLQPTAFDRFHISEVVYGPMLRGQQTIDETDLEKINQFLRLKRVPVILCLPPFGYTFHNVRIEGRDRPAYQTYDFLKTAYDRFQTLAPYATLVFDYTKDPLPII